MNGHLLVITDCVNLEPGALRFSRKGSDGGHNGLRDIISKLGGNNFYRLRIGIDHPRNKNNSEQEVANYVLRRAPKEEQDKIDTSIDKSLEIIDNLFQNNWQKFTENLHTGNNK